ncbi:MAG: glycosyltransferase family 9 protein [Bacteroidales bacterium]|nr:glycosyltransferase family 9 protein [Bacteroidales bacterium]
MKKNHTESIEMHLLVIRTSAMGDVALAAPVIASLRVQYPEVKVTLLTRSVFRPFFNSIPFLSIQDAEFEGVHKGFSGLIRLYRDCVRKGDYDYVIDLHDVLRTKILRWLFRLSGKRTFVIDKGRAEKKRLIRGKDKSRLKHTVERYLDVFSRAGIEIDPLNRKAILPTPAASKKIAGIIDNIAVMNIGIAPYAKHPLKIWPEEYILRLADMISQKLQVRFWIFGGRDEYEKLSALQSAIPGSYSAAADLSLEEQLALMSRLDLMISMDSANMHMASLSGARVISVWGATDPLAGFGAWNQPEEFSMRIPVDELTCRPCTIYGKGKCRRGDFACMKWLRPEMIFNRLTELGIL